MSDKTDDETNTLNEKHILDINEVIKPLSDKDKCLISSKELSKSFENFVIKTIVNKKLNKNVDPKGSLKKIPTDKEFCLNEKNQRQKELKLHSKKQILVEKKSKSLKSVIATTGTSHRDSFDYRLKKYSNPKFQDDLHRRLDGSSGDHLYKRDDDNRRSKYNIENVYRSKYDENRPQSHRNYTDQDRPIYKRKHESPYNKTRKRTIGSLMDKYEDSIHPDYQNHQDDLINHSKSLNDKNRSCSMCSNFKIASSKDDSKKKNTLGILKNLKSRFEDQPIENKYIDSDIYYKKKDKIPLYSEHDDRFYRDDLVASFKTSMNYYRNDPVNLVGKQASTYQNYPKFFYYDRNPELYSTYYNPAAYYDPAYQQHHIPYAEAYYYESPKINPANASAIYGGIADFQDSFSIKTESIVKPEPGEHITYNKDYTSISLKYDGKFDTDDESASDSDYDRKKHSKKKKVPTATLR